MNFVKFPVNATNIFPMANTTKGGQYVTEFNLRALDSIATDENVQYMIGPSYVHSERDFIVTCKTGNASFFEDQTSAGTSTILTINPGRGIINGHFVELLTPIEIDLAAANAEGVEDLTGVLVVGLRAMYSTETTMAGALLPESVIDKSKYPNPEDHYAALYEGIQVVVLPKDEFVLPVDEAAWSDPSMVTGHIKLAEFTYINGVVKGLTNNYPQKCIGIPANRVGNVSSNPGANDGQSHSEFISKKNLDPCKLYTYGGWSTKKSSDGKELVVADTWCDSTDALMIWDSNPKPVTNSELIDIPEAQFSKMGNGVSLLVPHKQPDYEANPQMYDQDGNLIRYQTKQYPLPVAQFDTGSPGIVDSNYTANVKKIADRIREFYMWTNGIQRGYIEHLELDPDTQKRKLPPIQLNWDIGDYILVGTDDTVATETQVDTSAWIRNPSTMYVVTAGVVTKAATTAYSEKDAASGKYVYKTTGGVELASVNLTVSEAIEYGIYDAAVEDDESTEDVNEAKPANNRVPSLKGDLYSQEDIFEMLFHLESMQYTGRKEYTDTSGDKCSDYFTIVFTSDDGVLISKYHYPVLATGPKQYTEPPIMLTGQIPLASTDQIGGFLSVDPSAVGNGYVRIDENGNLVLVDYSLLVSGVLAYQLGEDFDCPAGFSYEEIQTWLDEYINERVAFPNANHIMKSKLPNVIFINLTLSKSDSPVTLNIGDIDSRFGTSICLNIYGTADSNTTINITNCEKIRIGTVDVSETGDMPKINLNRCNLYYDADIISIAESIENLRLWYEKYPLNDSQMLESLPDLYVNELTVSEVGIPQNWHSMGVQTEEATNDNHFKYTLKSITLDSQGQLSACSIIIKASVTADSELGKTIISRRCEIPSGNSLQIPMTKATRLIKVSGNFISSYNTTTSNLDKKALVMDNKFTMTLPRYNISTGKLEQGKFHCLYDTYYVHTTDGFMAAGTDPAETNLDGWTKDACHTFPGYAIS